MRRHQGPMRGACGYTLIELLAAMAAAAPVCAAALILIAGTGRLAGSWRERLEDAEARAVVLGVLAGELRHAWPEADLRAVGPDSVGLRAFRGTAVVCDETGDGLFVRYRGAREPEPAKDSLVRVGPAEAAYALAQSARAPGRCDHGHGETVYRWRVEPRPPAGALLLLFESGSYHIAAGAFRYRRGASGRQPLTAERFDDQGSAFADVAPEPDSAHHGTRLRVLIAGRGRAGRGHRPPDTVDATLRLLNPWRPAPRENPP